MMWRLLQMIMTPLANIGKARPARIAALGGAFSLMCLGLLWCTAQGISWAWHSVDHKLAQTLDMRIRDVTIVGGKRLDVTETLERHGLEIGALTADIDWDGARGDLARNPMLQSASIVRLSPERVVVRLKAREPIARLDRSGTKGDTILVDRSGLHPVQPGPVEQLAQQHDLGVVRGHDQDVGGVQRPGAVLVGPRRAEQSGDRGHDRDGLLGALGRVSVVVEGQHVHAGLETVEPPCRRRRGHRL